MTWVGEASISGEWASGSGMGLQAGVINNLDDGRPVGEGEDKSGEGETSDEGEEEAHGVSGSGGRGRWWS